MSHHQSVSIAMCTYNGEKYLQEQLDSIVAQTRLPDELVICDDGSTDKTVTIIKDFATKANFPVYLHINNCNLGSTKNFEKAISLCVGDIIFLADQDDVWLGNKLEKIETIFINSPETDAIFTDALVVDERLRRISSSLWAEIGFDKEKQNKILSKDAFELLAEGNVATGATVAFRKKYKDHVLPIPDDFSNQFRIHDGWIMLAISSIGKIAIVSEPLIAYRQHENNQIGLKQSQTKPGLVEKWKNARIFRRTKIEEMCDNYKKLHAHLSKRASISNDKHQLILERIEHLSTRASLPINLIPRLRLIAFEFKCQRYQKFSNGLYSVCRDIALI